MTITSLMFGEATQAQDAEGKHFLRQSLLVALVCSTSYPTLTLAEAARLEEVVVTAQKREQSLQTVPISVSVTDGEFLQKQNFVSLHDFSNNIPALSITKGGTSDILSIRGAASGGNSGFEQSVAIFVDGIYAGRSRSAQATFMDLERIEILKGPQSTFFGNNAIGGALSITTRKPTDKLEGYVSALYGSHGEYNLETAVSGPISETVNGRIAVRNWGMDGYVNMPAAGKFDKGPRGDNISARTTLAWTPSSQFDAMLQVAYGETSTKNPRPNQLIDCPPSQSVFPGPAGFCNAALASGDDTDLNKTSALGPGGERDDFDTYNFALSANYEEADHIFTSITGWSRYDYSVGTDIDSMSANLFNVFVEEDYEQFSQEFRITSASDRSLEYMVGAYYQRGKTNFSNNFNYRFLSPTISSIPIFSPLIPYLPFGQNGLFSQTDNSWSAFGALTFNVSDTFRISGGARWMEVEKDFRRDLYFGTAGQDFGRIIPFPESVAGLGNQFGASLATPGEVNLSRKDSDFMPSVNVSYDIASDSMVYASYTRGFKAGGFDGQDLSGVPDRIAFEPETVDAYEVGLKGVWLDGNLDTNLAIFRSEYEELQESTSQLQGNAIIFAVGNVGASISQGVELEARMRVSENLRFNVSFAYLDAKYTDFRSAGCTVAQGLVWTGPGPCVQDVSGKTRVFSPEYSGNIGADYHYPLTANLELNVNVNFILSDKYLLHGSLDPNLSQGSFAKIDSRVSVGSSDGRWDISVIGKNLTDERILNWGSPAPTSAGSYTVLVERPRNFALQLRYHW